MVGGGKKKNVQSSLLQLVIAAVIGVGVIGGILAFLHRGFISTSIDQNLPLSKPILQVDSLSCESNETINELKKQVTELNEKLRLAEEENERARTAGPYGTVKALITHPTVIPDESVNPRLAKLLSEIAVRNELIVALANANVRPILEMWFTSIKKVGIPNYLVVALDNATVEFCKSNDVPVYQRDPDEGIDSVGRTGSGAAVSALKFQILREFLQLGYSVLLSDTDIIYLQNPFDHLYRDSDVESMSDGHDNSSAYGYCDSFYGPEMQWSALVYTTRIWAYNSGFFYIRATIPSIELLDRVADVLSRPPFPWDQAVFNEQLLNPSRPGYVGLHASKRVMDIYLFMNSKVLFKTVRHDANLRKLRPAVVHVNYHPDKLPRMKAVFDFYVNGKEDALDPFPVGTPRT